MRKLRHPRTQDIYEWDDDGVGPVSITKIDGRRGKYDGRGGFVEGDRFQVDPELCRWIATGGGRPARAKTASPSRRRLASQRAGRVVAPPSDLLPDKLIPPAGEADLKPRTSVSVRRYIDREFHELEKRHVWSRTWQFACRVDHLAEIGDTYLYEICDRSLVLVRVAEGDGPESIRAFHNVCLHRGRALVDSPCRVQELRCPFHGFTWALDGTSVRTPSAADFADVDPEDLRLPQALVGVFAGFVFVNFDLEAQPLEEFIGDLPEHLAPWDFSQRYVEMHIGKVLRCNWKVVQEAFMEALHVTSTHPQMTEHYDDVNTTYDIFGNFTRMVSPRGVPSPRLMTKPTEQEIYDSFVDRRLDELADTEAVGGATARALLAERLRHALRRSLGDGVDELADDELVDVTYFSLFPNFHPWGAFNRIVYRFRPYRDDHERAVMELMFLSPFVGERPPPSPLKMLGEDQPWTDAPELASLCRVLEQDTLNHEAQQRGLKAAQNESLTLASYQERTIGHFHDLFDQWIASGSHDNDDTVKEENS